MFRIIVLSMVLLFTLNAFGVVVSTQVREVDEGSGNENVLVMLANGSVAKLPAHSEFVGPLLVALEKNTTLNIRMNSKREILGIESRASLQESVTMEEKSLSLRKIYSPSVVSSYEKAVGIFKTMNRRSNEESQCYNRAHVWSYEMYNKHQVRAMKVFVFFTKKYIRRYNFEWWFHVSPYVLVNENGQTVERVMDHKYTRHPTLMKEWTDVFLHNNAQCANIEKYTDYEYNREASSNEWCMLLRTSMYYYQPLDLESLDKKGAAKDFWVEWELNNAYREAFSYRH